MISLSGQFDPEKELIFPGSHWINFKVFKYILPRFIWLSNVEKLTHPKAQEDVLSLYSSIQVPVEIVHGDQDGLVPYGNASLIMKQLPAQNSKMITLPGRDHPIHMTDVPTVMELLMPSN